MDACESAELRHLRKVCEVQRDYIDGKINKEIYQRQIDDANCTYKFYLQEEIEKLKLEKDQIDIMIHFSKLLSHEKNNISKKKKKRKEQT